jgi:hypothetical protein
VEQAEAYAISANESHTFAKAITDNKTWSMEELLAGHRAIGLK